MSLLSTLKGLFFVDETRGSLASPEDWMYTLLGGAKTASGVMINAETALKHSAVFACIKVLAESVASLPLELFFSDKKETKVLTEDLRYRIVNSEPHELYTSYDFRIAAMVRVCTAGNFYADIIRDGNKRPVGLKIISESVAPDFDPNGELWYKISGRRLPVRPRDILHIKGFSSDGIDGKSPISIFKETIGLGIATTEAQGNLWKNGMLSMGYLKHPQRLQPDQIKEIKENFRLNYSGKDNAGKMPVLQGGMDFIPLTLKPADALFIETAKLSRNDICAIFRVPPHMIGDLERSTNNNIEHQSLEFVQHTLRPILKSWEQELNRKLLFETEKTSKFFRFNIDGLLRGDTKSRGEFFTRALGSVSNPAWMTPNEVRGYDNLNPLPGGDVLYTPTLNKAVTNDAAAQTNDTEDEEEPGAAN